MAETSNVSSQKLEVSGLVFRQLSQSLSIHELLLESQLNLSIKSWGKLGKFWFNWNFSFRCVTRSDQFRKSHLDKTIVRCFNQRFTNCATFKNHTAIRHLGREQNKFKRSLFREYFHWFIRHLQFRESRIFPTENLARRPTSRYIFSRCTWALLLPFA